MPADSPPEPASAEDGRAYRPGAVVAGRYRLERLLGRGGMGEVWAAEQTITRKKVAVKFLVAPTGEADELRRRFLREARAACAVQHPNVVQIHDVIEVDQDTPALVMELLKGESLEAKLQRDQKLPVEEALAIMLRVVSAVGTAHTLGVIHRDIKPDNIFLAETPEGIDVKVLDFGIAKMSPGTQGQETANLTATGSMLGTPYYMSPEQAFGEKRIDHRADIWSIGIVLYRCLSGVLPTQADNLGQILKIIMTRSIPKLATVAPELPAPVTAIVDRMLGYSPADRPGDLREVKEVLEGHLRIRVSDFGAPAIDASSLGGVTSPVMPPTPASGAAAPRARRVPRAAIALGGALVFGLVTIGILVGDRNAGTGAASPGGSVSDSAPPASSSSASTAPTESATQSSTPESSVTVEPAASASATPSATAARTGRVPQGSTAPTTAATAAAPAATTTPSSGWGGIVEKPGF